MDMPFDSDIKDIAPSTPKTINEIPKEDGITTLEEALRG